MKNRGVASIILNTILIIFFSLLAITALVPQSAASADATFTSSEIFPISNSLISLSLVSPPLTKGTLISYDRQVTDRLEKDDKGNIWLSKKGVRIGAIVGPRQEHLFRLPENSLKLPTLAYLDKVSSYALSCEDGHMRSQSIKIKEIGRKSRPIDSVWGTTGLQIQIEHTILNPNSSFFR